MPTGTPSSELLSILNDALARELQVSVQYMLQHAIGAARESAAVGKTPAAQQSKFVASHSSVWLPGVTLKKIAIAEMRHAEAVAERLVRLGGEPTTQPAPIVLGKTIREMLENDREQERKAIELYRQIIDVAAREHDEETAGLFRRILSDEERHHQVFAGFLGET